MAFGHFISLLKFLMAVQGRTGQDRERSLKLNIFVDHLVVTHPDLVKAIIAIGQKEGTITYDPTGK